MLIKSGAAAGEGRLILTRNSCCRFHRLLSVWAHHISENEHFPVCTHFSLLSILHILHTFVFRPPAQVTSERNKTAVSGKKASLSCSYGLPEKVKQIIWFHNPAGGPSAEVASYAKRSDPMIEPVYQGRVWLTASLSDSQLTIQPVAVQDEGCYTCQYETHSDETKSAVVCLSTYGKYSHITKTQ